MKNLNKLFKPLIFFRYLIVAPNVTFLVLSVVKYIEKYLQRIFKTVLKAQTPILVFIIFLKGS